MSEKEWQPSEADRDNLLLRPEDNEILSATRQANIELRAEIERLRAFAERVRNWGRLPLTELTDTDHERATAYRRQLEVHAEMARRALEA